LPDGYVGAASAVLPAPSANKLLGWNDDALALQNYVAADIPVTAVSAFWQTVLDDASAGASFVTMFAGLSAETSPAVADSIILKDDSAGTVDTITLANLLKVINALTAETSPAANDELALYDASAGTADKITLENLLKVINALTADSAPDPTADYTVSYDTSAGAAKKVLIKDIGGPLVFLSEQTASTSASIDFISGITSTYDEYEVHLHSVVAATNNTSLYLRTSTDGGSTFAASGGDYDYMTTGRNSSNAAEGEAAAGAGQMVLTFLGASDGVSSTANRGGFSGVVRFFRPSNTTHQKHFIFNGTYAQASGDSAHMFGAGHRLATADIDAIRFLFSSGNIASGTFVLYGIKKS